MPLLGSVPLRSSVDSSLHYAYKYPEGLALKPGTDRHDKLRDMILDRAKFAYDRISRRHPSWRELDKTVNGFIWSDDEEQRQRVKDPRNPISIVVPMTLATLEARLTYYTSTFLTYPYFRYSPQGPEDRIKALLLERVVDMQMQHARAGLALHTQFRDNCLYGIGAGAVQWQTKIGHMLTADGNATELGTVWEGNTIKNINPYRLLADPNVSANDIQDGEFIGWITRTNYVTLLGDESNSQGKMFNVRYLHDLDCRSSIADLDESERDRDRVSEQYSDPQTHVVDLLCMYVRLIPNDWNLGTNVYPETWLFYIAGDQVIVACEPLQAIHNMLPVSVIATGCSGYELAPVSPLEAIYGLQTLMNFQLNSYIASKKLSVNSRIVFDPGVISQRDIQDSRMGGFIRSRRTQWGGDLRGSVFQLDFRDTATSNIPDMFNIWQVAERASSISQAMLGEQRQSSERVTGQEWQGTMDAALNRLEREFKLAGMQGMEPYARIIASNTIQYMNKEVWVKVAGREESVLRQSFPDQDSVLVNPDTFGNLDIDIIPHDMRSLHKASPQELTQVFAAAAQNPVLSQKYDIGKMFERLASQQGWDDISLYRNAQVQVMPDQQVQQQMQAGNLVPIAGGM